MIAGSSLADERSPAARKKLADELAAPAIRSVRVSGAIALLLLAGLVGVVSLVPISSGTLANGLLAVQGERKTVQHATGGIVSAILVKEGDVVTAGQTVLRLDAVQAGAAAGVVDSQVDSLLAQEAVRFAESTGLATVSFPANLTARGGEPQIASLLKSEMAAFEARRQLARSQVLQFDTQLAQIDASMVSSRSASASEAAQFALLKEELDAIRALFDKGLALRSRVLALERAYTESEGRVRSLDAEINRLTARRAEIRSLRARVDVDRRAKAAEAFREVRAALSGALDRQLGTSDTLDRTEVKAPIGGVVMAVRPTTVGGVVEAGQDLMEIVPQGQQLEVRVRVGPADADDVHQGQPAMIRLDAGGYRSAPQIEGTVRSISADALTDARTGQAYFEVRVSIPSTEEAKTPPGLIAPGLPADVLIQTGSHTILQYLISPLERAMFGSMRDS